jgi:hypothetical protein
MYCRKEINLVGACGDGRILKPHCIQSSRNQLPGLWAWRVADAVTLSSTMHTSGIELASSALTSTLKWAAALNTVTVWL